MIDLVKVVKENLPNDVILVKEPYPVRLSEDFLYTHGYKGYVFHFRYMYEDGSHYDDNLFISNKSHATFHNAISLFHKSIDELYERCYWVDENDVIKEIFNI